MASSAKNQKTKSAGETQLQLLYGEDSLTKYWNSSLFNTVYLRHDIPDKHSCWKDDDSLEFQNFMSRLRDIAAEYKDREKELSNWSETETINNWVKHILHALGWTNNCSGVQNPFLEETSFRYDGKTYRTDILLVDHPKEKQYINQAKGDEKLVEARQSVIMPIEVKYWNRLEEYRQGHKEEKGRSDNESDDIVRLTTPNEQTVQYMTILKKNWGILTDGARWRLFNADLSAEDAERYYEFNFFALFQALTTEETELDSLEITEAGKYFYHFFSKFAFYPLIEGERPFVDEVLHYSKKYVNRVEEDLKGRFVKAMNIACNAIFKATKQAGNEQDNQSIRNVSESALFNILFIKSLESRGVLPMAATDYKKISLSSIIDKIEKFDPEKDDLLNIRELERAFRTGNGNSFSYKPNGTELHDRILRLTGVIHKGASTKDSFGFEISGFKESIFSTDEWKLFSSSKIQNHDWVRILFELGYAESESLNRKYQQIPYAYFTPRQLGSIYESFLEFKLEKSNEEMVYEKNQWRPADLNSRKYKFSDLPKVRKGELFFTPDNEDRKASGSYYTPEYIVDFMVKSSVKSLTKNLDEKGISHLKVCDPSCGSGHFLVGALNYLTKLHVEKMRDDSNVDISEIKKTILHNCIFGTDINPRATKLTKLSLWLNTAKCGECLEDLDDQIFAVDFFKASKQLKQLDIDVYIGNPPYINTFLLSKNEEYKEFLRKNLVSAQGNFDIASLFVEQCAKYSPDAIISFIVPNKILNSGSSQGMRAYLDKGSVYLKAIDDISTLPVFDHASVYPIILQFVPVEPKSTVYRIHKETFDTETAYRSSKSEVNDFNLLAEELSGEEVASFNGRPVGEILQIRAAATVDEAYKVVKPNLLDSKREGMKFVVSKNIFGFGNSWGHEKVSYLKDQYDKPTLSLNTKTKQKSDLYKRPKIIIPNMTTSLRAFYDEDGMYAPGISTTLIYGDAVDLKIVTVFLNSSIATSWYKMKYKNLHLNGGALRVGVPQVETIPIPDSILKGAVSKKLSTLYDQLSKEVGKQVQSGIKIRDIKSAIDNKASKNKDLNKLVSLVLEVDTIIDKALKADSIKEAA